MSKKGSVIAAKNVKQEEPNYYDSSKLSCYTDFFFRVDENAQEYIKKNPEASKIGELCVFKTRVYACRRKMDEQKLGGKLKEHLKTKDLKEKSIFFQ